jgi:hypothetical protein
MLNAHSRVCVPHELQILFEYSGNGSRLYEVFSSGLNKKFSAQDFISLFELRCPHRFDLFFDYKDFLTRQRYPILDLRQLVVELYNEIALSKNKSLLAEQTPWYGQRIDILESLFPGSKYIHLVRDGRDVAISYARTPWWSNDVYENVVRWESEVAAILDASERYIEHNQILHVRYEDLVFHPKKFLLDICRHIGIDYELTMLDQNNFIDYAQYSKINSARISSSSFNLWRKNKKSTTFVGSSFAWKKSHTYDFSRNLSYVSDMLERFGYER